MLWAENIIRVFSSNPDLIKLAGAFIRIAALGYLLSGITATLQQCISGAGDTFMPMAIMLVNMWLVQVPLAYLLPRVSGLGVYGVRWAVVAGAATAAAAYIIYFRMGKWKLKRV